jgi:hypothetical protein
MAQGNRGKRVVQALAVLVAVLLLLGVVQRFRAQAQVERVRRLSSRLTGEDGRKLSEEERREAWRRVREEVGRLSPKQRSALREDRRKASRERLARFFKMSPAEKQSYLDQQIDSMEQLRKRWQSQGGRRGNGPGGPPGGGRSLSPEERDRRRKDRLDQTTPEERAQRAEFFKALSLRRQQRGLGGWGFPGGGR